MQPNDHAVATPIGIRLCEKCSAKIFAPASTGFCSACLLEEGLNLLAGENFDSLGEAPAADFGDYELLGEIGRGGQGVVFRARQKSLNRIVALKIIALGTWATETHLKRFRREAEAAASLEHPRIVPIYEIGERDGTCYFTMQFVEGGQLDGLVRREPLPLRRAAEIIASLAHTVHYAHERGILHRDIKPGNILLDGEGEPHLTDFGLARLIENESTITRTLEVLGTPSFIAPEQAAGNGVSLTSATDVYGLGAVFYHLLTGHPPFAGGTTYETIRLVLETEPRHPKLWNAKVDRDLTTICLKCLEKDPLRRYPSALALAEDLERWLGHEPIRARHAGIFYRSRKWIRRHPTRIALLSLGAALLGAIALLFWNHEPLPPAGIAVLPFANLDGDKKDTVFADGIQDDILSRLARIADLKVISRTSVMNYRGTQNTRQIGDALHVSHLLEGSVRRSANRLRLNVQLIDVRSDEPVWAEEYERSLSDVSALQSDIAQQIADELHVKLSPNEKAAIAHQPTKDLEAYDLYVCGAALIDSTGAGREDCIRSLEFLNKAIARDPNFLLAYCKLAKAYDLAYFNGDRTPGRLAQASAAIQSAQRLDPHSGETHLALAMHLYWGSLDYDGAHAELDLARRTLPNDARIAEMAAFIDRRQGRWAESARERERESQLDPRNESILASLASTYWSLRDYEKAGDALDRALALKPDDAGVRMARACLDVGKRGDTRSANAVMENIIARDPSAASGLGMMRFWLALYARDFAAASRILKTQDEAAPDFALGANDGIQVPRAFFEGWLSQLQGDAATARIRFLAARDDHEKITRENSHGTALCALGVIDARLGRKEDALREGRRALELTPLTKSALEGADVLYGFALICAWTGERDLALAQVEKLAKIPGGPAYGEFRLDPSWDALRDDPRFEKIVRSLAPNDAKTVARNSP